MFRITIDGPANVYFDHQSVYMNSTFAESQLNNINHPVFFYRFRECVTAGILIVHIFNTNSN